MYNEKAALSNHLCNTSISASSVAVASEIPSTSRKSTLYLQFSQISSTTNVIFWNCHLSRSSSKIGRAAVCFEEGDGFDKYLWYRDSYLDVDFAVDFAVAFVLFAVLLDYQYVSALPSF
jgi:hypothetical protein